MTDIYDGTDWTEMDIEDLKAAIAHGRSVDEAAEFLCRAGSVDDVARKCRELGLEPSKKTSRREPAQWLQKKRYVYSADELAFTDV